MLYFLFLIYVIEFILIRIGCRVDHIPIIKTSLDIGGFRYLYLRRIPKKKLTKFLVYNISFSDPILGRVEYFDSDSEFFESLQKIFSMSLYTAYRYEVK